MDRLKRLLIVDDEETLTFSLYQTFIKSPVECEVMTAASGEEAMQKIIENPFDIIITDIAMPGISGFELLGFVKAKNPETKVIVITAYGTDEKHEIAMQRGASRYIEKPFDIHELREIVFSMLN